MDRRTSAPPVPSYFVSYVSLYRSHFEEIFRMKAYLSSLRFALALLGASLLLFPNALFAQSLTSGDVTGTVLDPSGAAVPNATVSLKNNDTGATQTATTTSTGAYRFHLLNPGSYTVSSAATGFQGRA